MRKLTLFTLICFFAVSGISIAGNLGYSMRSSGFGSEGLTIPGGKWWRMPKAAKKLELTKAEQKKLDRMFIQNRRRMIDLKRDAAKEKLELEDILDKENFNESACMGRFKKLMDASTELTIERFRFLVEVRNLLGIKRFQLLKANFRERRMGQKEMRAKQRRKRPVQKPRDVKGSPVEKEDSSIPAK